MSINCVSNSKEYSGLLDSFFLQNNSSLDAQSRANLFSRLLKVYKTNEDRIKIFSSLYEKHLPTMYAIRSIEKYRENRESGNQLLDMEQMIEDHLFLINAIHSKSIYEVFAGKKPNIKSDLFNVMMSFVEEITPHLRNRLDEFSDNQKISIENASLSKIIKFDVAIVNDVRPIYYYALFIRCNENEMGSWGAGVYLATRSILELDPKDRKKVFSRIIKRFFESSTDVVANLVKLTRALKKDSALKELKKLIKDYKKEHFTPRNTLLAYLLNKAREINKKENIGLTEVNIALESTIKDIRCGEFLDKKELINELEECGYISFTKEDTIKLTVDGIWQTETIVSAVLFEPYTNPNK